MVMPAKIEQDELSPIPVVEERVPDEPVTSDMELAGADMAERKAIQDLARQNLAGRSRQSTLAGLIGERSASFP